MNVNPAYKTQELGFILDRSGVSVLVAARGFRAADYVAMLEEVHPALPGLREVVLLGEGSEPWAMSWAGFLALGEEASLEALRGREALLDPEVRSTSSTRAERRGSLRERRSRTTTS